MTIFNPAQQLVFCFGILSHDRYVNTLMTWSVSLLVSILDAMYTVPAGSVQGSVSLVSVCVVPLEVSAFLQPLVAVQLPACIVQDHTQASASFV